MRRVTNRFPIRFPAADRRSEDFLVGPIVPNRPQATHAFVREAMDNARSSDGNEDVKKIAICRSCDSYLARIMVQYQR